MKFIENRLQNGFTLVEMLVVAPIVILTIGAFLTVIISMTGEVLSSRASNSLSYNVQDALNHIEQDVKMSSSFLATNNITLAADTTYTNSGVNTNEKQGYSDDTTAFTNIAGSSGTSLILNMVATTTNPISASSSYVYLKNKPNACASAPGFNVPLTYNVVYFTQTVSGTTTLYRRTIMPNSYGDTTNTTCNTSWQQPSCSPTYMDVQSTSVFCQTKDIALVSGTSLSFLLQYFNGEATTAVNSVASTAVLAADRNVALQSATTLGVSIDAQQTAAGRSIERTAILRVSRLDSNASSIATTVGNYGFVTTLAGSGTNFDNDGTGTGASFNAPYSIAVDASGTVDVADTYNNAIRQITSAGVVTRLAGSGVPTFADGTGTGASFISPYGVAVNASGTIYVADRGNHRIRQITSAGVVTTLAGSTQGYADGTGTSALFNYPDGVAVDSAGTIYVADTSNHRIRKITSAGVVTTLAGSTQGYADGTGTSALFSNPSGVAVDASGTIYVADQSNNRIRKITSAGVVTTLAGSTLGYADGTGTIALFMKPTGVAVDASGTIYVADQNNFRIRKIQ